MEPQALPKLSNLSHHDPGDRCTDCTGPVQERERLVEDSPDARSIGSDLVRPTPTRRLHRPARAQVCGTEAVRGPESAG